MKIVYPAAHGPGGFAFQHYGPRPVMHPLPYVDVDVFDAFRRDLEAEIVNAFRIPALTEPNPAVIKDRLGEFVRRYALDPTVIDVRADPGNPNAVIVDRRVLHAAQLAALDIERRQDAAIMEAIRG